MFIVPVLRVWISDFDPYPGFMMNPDPDQSFLPKIQTSIEKLRKVWKKCNNFILRPLRRAFKLQEEPLTPQREHLAIPNIKFFTFCG